MNIGIIVAMDKELELFMKFMELEGCGYVWGNYVYQGYINEHDITVVKSGIGKVNAAMTVLQIFNNNCPNLIINTGVCGGLGEDIKVGDIIVADSVCYHDVWCGSGTKVGQVDGCPLYFNTWERGVERLGNMGEDVKVGLICSGDRFIAYPDQAQSIKTFFPKAIGCDMESAAIAQVCQKNNIPFVIIRMVSDNPLNGEDSDEYENFWESTPEYTFDIVKRFIEKL